MGVTKVGPLDLQNEPKGNNKNYNKGRACNIIFNLIYNIMRYNIYITCIQKKRIEFLNYNVSKKKKFYLRQKNN